MISVLILTKNEEQDLPACIDSVRWCSDVHVLDSFSNDRTCEIATRAGCTVTQRRFDNWSAHQNWALRNIPFKNPWVFYLDADERVSAELVANMQRALAIGGNTSAYRIRRRDFSMDGTWLRHAQISPYFIRVFRPQLVHYERLVNPVAMVDGPIGQLEGFLDHYPFSKGFGFWLSRHIKYADFEAQTKGAQKSAMFLPTLRVALLSKDFNLRRAAQKSIFYRLPFRPLLKWSYMMFVRRAFLDGFAGMQYAMLQAIYEYIIVLNESEIKLKGRADGTSSRAPR